jgi:molybdopterin molybdotransferase
VGLLAACGVGEVKVGRRPVVGLVATGSELLEVQSPKSKAQSHRGANVEHRTSNIEHRTSNIEESSKEPGVGKIYESNRVMLAGLVRRAGGVPKVYPLVPDDLETTVAALEKAFKECDVVVTSGGVSVGELDFVKSAFERMGGKLDFWRVAIKPGRPFVFGRREGKFLFGLPGNPVSAFVTFLLLARPALLRCQGAKDVSLPVQRGVAGEALANDGGRRHFLRVRVDREGRVYSAGTQASHMLSSLGLADGLVEVGPGEVVEAGREVKVFRGE